MMQENLWGYSADGLVFVWDVGEVGAKATARETLGYSNKTAVHIVLQKRPFLNALC